MITNPPCTGRLGSVTYVSAFGLYCTQYELSPTVPSVAGILIAVTPRSDRSGRFNEYVADVPAHTARFVSGSQPILARNVGA